MPTTDATVGETHRHFNGLSILGQALRQELAIVLRLGAAHPRSHFDASSASIFANVESRNVPSVLVLVLGREPSLSNVGDAVAAGAKRVRFTEVTVRAADANVFRYRPLDDDADLSSFDGLVVVSDENMTPAALPTALQRLADMGSATNTVMAHVGAGARMASQLLDLGGIMVSARGATIDETAQAVGERVAKVAGWVRHALGHEAEHQHGHHENGHHAGHDHHHGHGDAHAHAHGHDHGHDHAHDHAHGHDDAPQHDGPARSEHGHGH